MERFGLFEQAGMLFFGALMLNAALLRAFRVRTRGFKGPADRAGIEALREEAVGRPKALLIVPAVETLVCFLPLLLAFDGIDERMAWLGVLASASAFAASRFVLSYPGLEFDGPSFDDRESRRRDLAAGKAFGLRLQAFVLGGFAGVAFAVLALDSRSLLLVYVVHVIGKFTFQRISDIHGAE